MLSRAPHTCCDSIDKRPSVPGPPALAAARQQAAPPVMAPPQVVAPLLLRRSLLALARLHREHLDGHDLAALLLGGEPHPSLMATSGVMELIRYHQLLKKFYMFFQ